MGIHERPRYAHVPPTPTPFDLQTDDSLDSNRKDEGILVGEGDRS